MNSAVETAEFKADAAPAEAGAAQAKILLVDDEPKSLFALQELLSTLEQNLMVAQSGEEALRLALKNDFAVILLDVRMPGIDGFETARLIRARERSKSTPIIFLTAAAEAAPQAKILLVDDEPKSLFARLRDHQVLAEPR